MTQRIGGSSGGRVVAWRFVVFSFVLVMSLFSSPLVAIVLSGFMPAGMANWLFFWPQTALAYHGFTAPAGNLTRTFLGGGLNFIIAAMFWSAVGLALACSLRSRNVLATAAVALPVAFVAAWAALVILRLVDIGIYLDGP